MSKLMLSRIDVEKAVRQYYEDYERELYKKYDFDSIEMYFEDRKLGYSDVIQVIPENRGRMSGTNNRAVLEAIIEEAQSYIDDDDIKSKAKNNAVDQLVALLRQAEREALELYMQERISTLTKEIQR